VECQSAQFQDIADLAIIKVSVGACNRQRQVANPSAMGIGVVDVALDVFCF